MLNAKHNSNSRPSLGHTAGMKLSNNHKIKPKHAGTMVRLAAPFSHSLNFHHILLF